MKPYGRTKRLNANYEDAHIPKEEMWWSDIIPPCKKSERQKAKREIQRALKEVDNKLNNRPDSQ
jgi:predicted protein tyrosine phosphatase